MFPLISRSRHPVAKFLRSSPIYPRRYIHASPSRRGGIFRNAEGRWSTSVVTIGTFTLRDMFAILGGLLTSECILNYTRRTLKFSSSAPVYVLCKIQDAEKECQEFEARARVFLVQGINERRRAVKLLIAARECLRQKETKVEQEGEPFDEKEARLKVETLKVLERQEKFLHDLDAGEPVEVAPGHVLRKSR